MIALKNIPIILFSIIFCNQALAVEPRTEPDVRVEAQQEKDSIIGGRCLDSEGKPISHTLVLLFCQDYKESSLTQVAESQTDVDGYFTLGPITPLSEEDRGRRSYIIFVPADSHGPAWKVSDIQSENSQELKAYKPAAVSGTVLTENSEPVIASRVWISQIIPEGIAGEWSPQLNIFRTIVPLPGWSAITKSDGSFHITGVPGGTRIQLVVSHHDFVKTVVFVKPGVASQIIVQPGAVIQGRVLYAKTGQPATGVIVQAQSVDYSSWAQTVTDERGRYRLESLRAERYNIWARAEDLTVIALDSFEVEAGQEREAPNLRLVEGGFIVGRVIDEEIGKPIKPGTASDVAIYGPSRPKSGAAVESSRIREDGSFRIRVAPGRNYIYLRPREDWGRGKAIATPKHHWVYVANGQVVEVEFKIRKLSEDEIGKGRISQGFMTRTFRMPRTIDELEQLAEKLKQLGVAIMTYADKHEDTLPQTLQEVKSYVEDAEKFDWLIVNVRYIGKGETTRRKTAQIPIAYDQTLLDESYGTHVLFLDFSVRYIELRKLKELGIDLINRESIRAIARSLVGKLLTELTEIKIDFITEQAKEKKVLICFFDMNQRPSRYCIRQLAKQSKQLKDKGVIIIAVHASKIDENTLNEWEKKNNIAFPVGMIQGDEEQTRFAWGVKSLPWLILTDKKHIVKAEGFSINELDEKITTLRKK